jgi:uncharacterized protein YegP (UPF0339 family)
MAGMFEVFVDAESHFRFRLRAPDGSVLAVSAAFDDKRGAAAGIAAVRECAGMGLVTDLCPANRPGATPEAGPAAIPQAHENQPARADGFRARARKLRRAAARPRWTGAAWVSARVAGA